MSIRKGNIIIAGSGGGTGGGIANVDNATIITNADGSISTIAIKDQNNTENVKFWTGTLAEYEALEEYDENTLYNVTDDDESVEGLGQEIEAFAGQVQGLQEEVNEVKANVKVASAEKVGLVKPDGTTITIAEDGTISAEIPEIEVPEIDTDSLIDVDTDQKINSTKTIANQKSLNLESGNNSYTGKLYGGTGNAGNVILECANDTGASPEQLIIGEQGIGSAYYRRGMFLSVPTDEAIYLGEVNTACNVEAVNDLKLYGGYKQNSYLHLSNDELKYVKADGSNVDLLSAGGAAAGVASIVEVYGDSTSGYRLWSDGYCEQWGTITNNKAGVTVTLHKPYKDTSYKCIVSCNNIPTALSNGMRLATDLLAGVFSYTSSHTTTSFISVTSYIGVMGGYGAADIGTSIWVTYGYMS